MLAVRTLSALTGRTAITAVSETGLVLTSSGDERHAPWEAVDTVVAGVAAYGEGEMFVLALNVDAGEATELFAMAESERLWPELTAMLSIGLPVVEPFERWGAALVENAGVVTLYQRPVPSNAS